MGQTAQKWVTAKDPSEKLAHRRMTVLELAERLGNVSEACRRGGIDRTSFYDWKRRFQLQGLDGLKDLPPVAKTHPCDRHLRRPSASRPGATKSAQRWLHAPDLNLPTGALC